MQNMGRRTVSNDVIGHSQTAVAMMLCQSNDTLTNQDVRLSYISLDNKPHYHFSSISVYEASYLTGFT